MATREQAVHFRNGFGRLPPQFCGKDDWHATANLAVIDCTVRDLGSEHLLQAQRLCAQLHLIRPALVGLTVLVLDRKDAPRPTPSMYSDAVFIVMQLH